MTGRLADHAHEMGGLLVALARQGNGQWNVLTKTAINVRCATVWPIQFRDRKDDGERRTRHNGIKEIGIVLVEVVALSRIEVDGEDRDRDFCGPGAVQTDGSVDKAPEGIRIVQPVKTLE